MPFISKGAAVFTALLLILFIWSAWKVNQQAARVNAQAEQIKQIIDDQSPLIFAFQNTGTEGRISFVITCERKESESKYDCVTRQTEPVQAVLTPVPTPSRTATPTR